LGSRATLSDDDRTESPEFQWEEEEKWHVVAKVYDETPRRKIYNSSVSGESDSEEEVLGLALPLPPERRKRHRKPAPAPLLPIADCSAAKVVTRETTKRPKP